MFRLSLAKREALAMAECEVEALSSYLADHYPAHKAERYADTEITSIITEKVRLPGGRIQVLISVINRKPWECDTFFYVLQVSGRKITRRSLDNKAKV